MEKHIRKVCGTCGAERVETYEWFEKNWCQITCREDGHRRKHWYCCDRCKVEGEKDLPISQSQEASTNICVSCRNACGWCPWSETDQHGRVKFEPVPGWTATAIMYNSGGAKLSPSYHITDIGGRANEAMEGRVVYIHPKGRYHLVEFTTSGGATLRECFQGVR